MAMMDDVTYPENRVYVWHSDHIVKRVWTGQRTQERVCRLDERATMQ